jgi:hypothetical protein
MQKYSSHEIKNFFKNTIHILSLGTLCPTRHIEWDLFVPKDIWLVIEQKSVLYTKLTMYKLSLTNYIVEYTVWFMSLLLTMHTEDISLE